LAVKIDSVIKGSPADKKGIKSGDKILALNGEEIMDVLDYRFYQNEKRLKVEIETAEGKVKKITVHKKEYDELGPMFDSYLMDKQHSCRNKCIFCFIDQLPKGMRDTLYFKDDDSRLSFLFGNYITLTNLSEHEINRIIKMHISPVNISVHTTNKELRCKMMNNRFAGESLDVLRRFNDAGISMNCQLVLCHGYNDGEQLKSSLSDLLEFENVNSVACVPVGLTKYRENLAKIEPYNSESAKEVIEIIDGFAVKYIEKYGIRKVYAADEFYLKAKMEIPKEEFYGDFDQLDNGVGMWALLLGEANRAIDDSKGCDKVKKTVVTGVAAYPLINEIVSKAKNKWQDLDCQVIAIKNDFFGEQITVAGLVTGRDIINQVSGKDLGEKLLIPSSMLRHENDMFLDDVTVCELEEKLKIKVVAIENDGYELIEEILGEG